MWGLMRVMSDASCPIQPLDGLTCKGQDSIIFDPPADLPRPGDPAPGGSGSGSGSGDSGGGSSTGGGGGASSSTGTTAKASSTSRAARNLKIPSRLKLRTFGLKGMRIVLDVSSDAKVLDLRLMRRTGGRLKPVLSGSVKIAKVGRNGHVVLTWKPGRNAVAKLPAGNHVLRVRVGPGRTRLSVTVAAPVRLVGPRLRAAAARRR
jgi:hypothetical protein